MLTSRSLILELYFMLQVPWPSKIAESSARGSWESLV